MVVEDLRAMLGWNLGGMLFSLVEVLPGLGRRIGSMASGVLRLVGCLDARIDTARANIRRLE